MLSILLATLFTFVELNCENLFDYTHDEGKNDHEFLPTSTRKWDKGKYWRKVNGIAQEIIACGGEGDEWTLPDLVALTEVENDSVMHDLTTRSPLRNAGYQYVMTNSDDERGIDVALLYSPFSFRLLDSRALCVTPPQGKHATRDILYAKGLTGVTDTLHVFVVHAPSRVSGAKATQPYRMRVAQRIVEAIDSIHNTSPGADIVVAGDFNDIPSSWLYAQVSKYLNDTYRDKGIGICRTYNGNGFPHFRIDYVFHSKEFQTLSYKRIKTDISDHYPVITSLELAK